MQKGLEALAAHANAKVVAEQPSSDVDVAQAPRQTQMMIVAAAVAVVGGVFAYPCVSAYLGAHTHDLLA